MCLNFIVLEPYCMSFNRFHIVSSIIFLCVFTLDAAEPYQPVRPDPVLESWRWKSFPELKGRGLFCMAEDGDGNMWFGVRDGVMRWSTLDAVYSGRWDLWFSSLGVMRHTGWKCVCRYQ